MFFRNLTMYRFPAAVDFSEIESQIEACKLRPVGPLEMASRGFVSPFGRESSELVHRVAGAIHLAIGTEARILPAAVVNDALATKIAEIEAKEGRRPGGGERKRIKDDLLHELLPKAFIKRATIHVLIIPDIELIAVDTPSRRAGDDVVSDIRGLLGSFPAMTLNAEVSPQEVLTRWVSDTNNLPFGLVHGDEAELREPMEGGAVARVQRQELESEEVHNHLNAGKRVAKLGLNLMDHLSFTLGDDLIVRKLKFLDGATEQLEDSDSEDRRIELDARFALQVGEIRELFRVLAGAFRISEADA